MSLTNPVEYPYTESNRNTRRVLSFRRDGHGGLVIGDIIIQNGRRAKTFQEPQAAEALRIIARNRLPVDDDILKELEVMAVVDGLDPKDEWYVAEELNVTSTAIGGVGVGGVMEFSAVRR